MKQALFALIVLAACGKGSGTAQGGDDCAAAVAHLSSMQAVNIPKQLPEKQKKIVEAMAAKMNGVITASCREHKWSKEALDCIKATKATEDMKQCEGKLTPEQKAAVEKATKQAQQEAEKDLQEMQKPSGDEKAAALKGITALRDEMCACKDAACAEAVYKKWGDVEKASEGARHDEATREAWNKIDDELMKCKSALK